MRFAILAALVAHAAVAQTPADVAAERADFARWLETSPVSPFAAIYHQPLAGELALGPGGDPALAALPPSSLREERRRLALETEDGTKTVPRNRDVPLGEWRVRVSGDRGRSAVTVFDRPRAVRVPGWYPYDAELRVEGTLEPPSRREVRRMLALDGVEVEATLAGALVTQVAGEAVRLVVYRMPEPGSEESELMIFFRDATNGDGTYPAGRFVMLLPLGNSRYRVDFNRARNPFCAYNGIFPCPLPWPGNEVGAPVAAGEKYAAK